MSVTLREVIEAGGYDINKIEDARWLKSKQSEFEELIEHVELVIEQDDEAKDAELEAEYKKAFPDEDDQLNEDYLGEDRGGANFTED